MQINNTPTQWARAKEVSSYFQITVQTLWRWRKLDGFPQPIQRTARTVLYDISAIEQWLAGEGA